MNAPTSPQTAATTEAVPPAMSYLQLFARFLKFGLLAWGGPVAQIGMLRRELVDEERWISVKRFNKLLAVMQVLPGPEAHELCVHLGIRAKGRLGGMLAGLGFMLPGFLLMFALSWLYFQIEFVGTSLGAAFLGIQAAVIALIVRAVHRIGEHILLDRWLWAIAIVCALAAMARVDFWITLPASGLVYALLVLKHRALALLVTLGAVALAAAARLGALQAVASSPYQRARQTAAAIVRRQGLTAVHDERLRERHYGFFQGLTYDEAEQLQARVIEALHPTEVFITDFTIVMGAHTGPGVIGLGYYFA